MAVWTTAAAGGDEVGGVIRRRMVCYVMAVSGTGNGDVSERMGGVAWKQWLLRRCGWGMSV